MTKTMSKWLGYKFSTGSFPGEDYLKFQRNAKASLKKMAEQYGFELFKFCKNHYCFSAVLREKDSGHFIYVSIPDVRSWQDEWANHVLIRTMAHESDWTGGYNNYCTWDEIGEKARSLVS